MADEPTLTGMQRHVFDNLGEVVFKAATGKTVAASYELRGKDVSAQINSLVAKGLISRARSGELSRSG